MANWAKGLDELGAGLLRQADIGGRAYEGAMAKEAEARAETRALSAERRAKTALLDTEERREQTAIRGETRREEAIIRGEGRADQYKIDAEGRAVLDAIDAENRAYTNTGLAIDREMEARFDLWENQKEKEWAKAVESGKVTRQHEILKAKYEEDASTAKGLMKSWIESNTGFESPQYLKAWRAEQNALASWGDLARSAGFTIGPPQEFTRLLNKTAEAVYAEVVSMDLQQEDAYNDFIAALEKGYGPGKEPNKASKDAMQTINDAIERLGITLPKEEKSKMVDGLVESFLANPDLRKGKVTVGDPIPEDDGDGVVAPLQTIPTDTSVGIDKVQAGLSDQLSTIESQLPELENQYKSIFEKRAKEKSSYNHSSILRRIFESGMPAEEVKSAYETNPDLFKDGKGDTISLDKVMSIWATNQQYSALQNKIRDMKSRAQEIKIEIQKYGNLGATPQASNMMGSKNRGLIAAVDQGISPQEFAYWEPEATEARAIATQQQGTA